MNDPLYRSINLSLPPKKQGGLFSIHLGQNNGPFLAKDIMITNQKSIMLLSHDDVAKTVSKILTNAGQSFLKPNSLQEAEEIYDMDIRQYTNFDEKFKTKMSAAENVNATSNFSKVAIQKLYKELNEYKQMIYQLKDDLKKLNQQVNETNIDSIRKIQPMLKEFQQNMKDNLSFEKNENYKLIRELDQLNREKLQMQQQILFSHKQIQDLEKLVGIQKPQEQVIDNAINEESEGELSN